MLHDINQMLLSKAICNGPLLEIDPSWDLNPVSHMDSSDLTTTLTSHFYYYQLCKPGPDTAKQAKIMIFSSTLLYDVYDVFMAICSDPLYTECEIFLVPFIVVSCHRRPVCLMFYIL